MVTRADPVSSELRRAEQEIDSFYASNPLVAQPWATSAWYFLAFCEEHMLRAATHIEAFSGHDFSALADNLIMHAQFPLKWLRRSCSASGRLACSYDDTLYSAAHDLSQLALHYKDFAAAFTYASQGLIRLEMNGRTIRRVPASGEDLRFEAYDRLLAPRGAIVPETDGGVLDDIASTLKLEGGSFRYSLNPRLIATAMEHLSPVVNERFSLPEDWQFSCFTLGHFKSVAKTLWVLSFIHWSMRLRAAELGCAAMGFASSVLLMRRDELLNRLRRYSGIPLSELQYIVETLIYGAFSQLNPDPALQPLVVLNSKLIALPPFLLLNSSYERNLMVLLNRLPEERSAYAKLSQEREYLCRNCLVSETRSKGMRCWNGNIRQWGNAEEVDLAIVSDTEKACLVLELKAFIDPAEPREIRDRSEEIAKGISQIKARQAAHSREPRYLNEIIRIDDSYRIGYVVVSDGSIGASFAQDSEVPVITLRHLQWKLDQSGLRETLDWLSDRLYLPTEGKEYTRLALESTVGPWTLEWYGIKVLADHFPLSVPRESSKTGR